ncbi:hypothetical protein MRX96_006368 [Rhipicephalus microplus]
MGPPPKPCNPVNSVVELPKPDASPPRTQRWPGMSPKVIVALLLFLCFSCVQLFLQSVKPRAAIPASKACPSENERSVERHFRSWDEKLEQALRLFGRGPPKTEEEAWHAVTDDIHVFTAFAATTTEHAIHITAFVRSRKAYAKSTLAKQPRLECIIRTSNRTIRGKARIRLVWTYFNPIFWNAFILCPLQTEISTANKDVQVAVAVQGAKEDSLRWLKLHHTPEKAKDKCCSVCVRPVFGSHVSLWKVVEYVTHYRTLGAKRFYFYDLDMSSSLKLLLGFLQSAGVDVTLVPFKMIARSSDVHEYGQMPALYDCIFRSMSRTEYYIRTDLDELIFLPSHNNFTALIEKEERKSNDVGSLVVPSRYACAEYPLNVLYSKHEYLPLQTRLFTYHNKDIPLDGYTKHIGRARAICEAAVHVVARHCVGYRGVELNDSVAFMNHYKSCCSFPATHGLHKLIRVWDVRDISQPDSLPQLSERIERDEVVRSLMKLLN